MRMGRLNKNERHLRKKPPKQYPKYSSSGLIVGSVSPNLYASVYTPQILRIAHKQLEDYAHELLEYEDSVKGINADPEHHMEVDLDGSIKVEEDAPPPPRPPLFSSTFMINEFTDMITDTSKYFSAPKSEWKIQLNAAKFERQLDEKYGILRPFITNHPQIEVFLKSMQRKYAMGHFSPFRQGDPPIPRTTSIIILFMMQRNKVRWEILTLGALFLLVGLQPWALVLLVALVSQQFQNRKRKLMRGVKPLSEPVKPYYSATKDNLSGMSPEDIKKECLRRPVGTKLREKENIDMSRYDTMILGSGPATLYTASLLARTGRSVLVLSPEEDASGCVTFQNCPNAALEKKYGSVPFDVESSNVARINRQQKMLAPALSTSTDYQGGVRFAQIGSAADGYAFEILSIPGMGAASSTDEIPFVMRASGGKQGLMDDTASLLGDGWPANDGGNGHSLAGFYADACTGMNVSSGEFYLSKILSEKMNDLRSKSTYQETAIRQVSAFLDKCFPLNAHLRSLFAGIGMKEENIRPSSTSMGPHVTNVCAALSSEGMYYPIGGPRALCHALAAAVEQSGGKIVTGVQVNELLFDEREVEAQVQNKNTSETAKDEKEQEIKCPRCVGVTLLDGRELRFVDNDPVRGDVLPAVISMHSFIHTFVRLLPENIRSSYKVPRGLPALTEQRPVFKVLVGLKGSSEDLCVTGADFYRLPGAALAVDDIDPDTGEATLGQVGWDIGGTSASATDDVASENKSVEKDTLGESSLSKTKNGGKFKFDPDSSWLKISFPSAKDPSFSSCHGTDVTTCVITVEADDDFVMAFDTKPKLFAIYKDKAGSADQRQRLLERVTKALILEFPQLEGENKIHL
jgi:hypothetical protein